MLISDPGILIARDRSHHPFIENYYQKLGLSNRLLTLEEGKEYFAKRMYTSCNSPIFHPIPYNLARKMLLSPGVSKFKYTDKSAHVPLSDRKYVVYGARKGLKKAWPVEKEEEIMEHLEKWVEKCTHLRFVDFNSFFTPETSFDDLLDLFGKAACVCGAHGGFFANTFFCHNDTLVVRPKNTQKTI